jgi:putative two-component system protein, hydrogenase maturation factor HypX/HoxX
MLRILLIAHSFNGLTQRLFVELRQQGHDVSVELDIHPAITEEAVRLFSPDLVIAPFLKRAIPEPVWRNLTCLVVHPGIPGDRGPSALDWAVLEGETDWGVTVLEANGDFDAGPVWAFAPFTLREATKSSLYRNEVTEAALAAVTRCVEHFARHRSAPPAPLGPGAQRQGRWRGPLRQADRRIDWQRHASRHILRAIRSADGMPGLLTEIEGQPVHVCDAHPAPGLAGEPGRVVAISGGDVAVATLDGALWIGQARPPGAATIKLPASSVIAAKPAATVEAAAPARIAFERRGAVGFLHFAFYNGAMGVAATQRLIAAFAEACASGVSVIVLMGGPDYWSNGMDLNVIESAASPADESWANINALDDLAEAVIRATGIVTIAALQGSAGAGGVFLARAADRVWMRQGAILNPHYKDMGNLHGSEFWTYLLPRHCGAENAARIIGNRLPMGSAEAVALGLADEAFGGTVAEFAAAVADRATSLAASPLLPQLIAAKLHRRAEDEAVKPLRRWREEELAGMRQSFYGSDPSYHVARYNFVRKVPKSRTPLTIARHRKPGPSAPRRMAT